MFDPAAHGSSVRTEVLAGITTFLTMAYIIVVNPAILAQAGMDHGAAFVATCLAAALGSILMGVWANLPVALAPGMGLNAYFAFVVVQGMGVPWQVALGAIFLSGGLFLIVSLLPLRDWLITAIPASLKHATGAGIGLFLGILGLKEMGVITAHPATLVTLGRLDTPATLLACLGFLLIGGLAARRVRGAVLIGILAVAAAGIPFGLTEVKGVVAAPPAITPVLLQLDIPGALSLGLLMVVLVFFLVDVLDNAGTLIATLQRAGLLRADGSSPRLKPAFVTAAVAAMLGAVLGTSTTTSYIESSAGIQTGGRTGLTAVLFLLALFLAPLAGAIGAFATGPALLFVACLMAGSLAGVDWDDVTEAVPAVVLALTMPLTFSIATAIGLGFITYAVVKALAGRGREVPGAVWAIAALSVVKFAVT